MARRQKPEASQGTQSACGLFSCGKCYCMTQFQRQQCFCASHRFPLFHYRESNGVTGSEIRSYMGRHGCCRFTLECQGNFQKGQLLQIRESPQDLFLKLYVSCPPHIISLYSCFQKCPYISQFSSVAQLCPTLCNPMNRNTPGLPVHHQLHNIT